MLRRIGRDVIRRWKGNPLISLDDLSFQCGDIMNAGVIRFAGEYLLLITIESLEGRRLLYLARSTDGKHFRVDDQPFMAPSKDGPFAIYESLGISDPRIVRVDETHYITYVAEGDYGLRLALARTEDFTSVERISLISQPDTKNGVLFPRKINGRYALLGRPAPGDIVWISYSDDLTFWGSSQVVMTARDGFWDPHRIGPAGPPIEIDQGWLLIYYGQKITSAGPLVRLGAAILDREDPARVIARSNIPILSPREMYERIGDVCNVVFSCGALLEDDGEVKVYYGASDSCICLGVAPLEEIVQTCLESSEEF